MSLQDGVSKVLGIVEANPVGVAAGAAGLGVVAGLGTAAVVGAVKKRRNKRSKTRNSRKRSSRIKHTSRGWKQDRKRRSKQKWEVAYQKRKKKGRSGVKYTKNGQPYIILSNGKARFIKGKRRKR